MIWPRPTREALTISTSTMPDSWTLRTALSALLLLAVGCATWQPAAESEGWSLFVQSGETVSIEEYHDAIQPAYEAVERYLGPFASRVRVHAWNGGVNMDGGNRGEITGDASEAIEDVPGIGPARVRAFHARGDGGPFSESGVFVGTANVGIAVHELVHAHFADSGPELPLWFEEGLAMILGDGAMYDGEWVVDGLVCWPWVELRKQELTDEHLASLLGIRSGDDHSVRDNVLVHFVGWAIAFDLFREVGRADWRAMLELFERAPDPLAEARRRIDHTLAGNTPILWLERLGDPWPAIRLAAVRGTWKLHSRSVRAVQMERIKKEGDPEVLASLAVNVLATTGQAPPAGEGRGQMWRVVLPVLRDLTLPDPDETSALRTLYRSYRHGSERYDTKAALGRLCRFWEE